MTSLIDENTVTVAEAAELLHVSQSTIWRWIKEGDLPAYHVGKRRVRIRRADLERMVEPSDINDSVSIPVEDGDDIEMFKMSPHESADQEMVAKHLWTLRERQLTRRGGVPFPSLWEEINRMRDERSACQSPHQSV